VERDALSADQFRNWIAWAKAIKIGMDFNQTYFAHSKVVAVSRSPAGTRPSASSGSSTAFRCREIGAAIGKALGKTCVTNLWIPDGMKDTPADRRGPRERLAASLDAMLKKKIDRNTTWTRSRGSCSHWPPRSYTPGSPSSISATPSAADPGSRRRRPLPSTEGIADKISSVLC